MGLGVVGGRGGGYSKRIPWVKCVKYILSKFIFGEGEYQGSHSHPNSWNTLVQST